MIIFKTVRWKNFLSTGNVFTEINLDSNPTTLIVGENGSGKSTLLDVICFSLFGKPYRNINKPQLVNTINNKNCLVEIEFLIGKKTYKIVRGIKPGLFEIWINGELVNQDAASRDYQKYLEESILKLNYKSFTQIVILGSASFTPFMQLPAAARREVIEDILDIKIFSAMNLVLREKVSELKDKLLETETKIARAKHKTELQQNYIKTLQDDRKQRIGDLYHDIEKANNEITLLQTSLKDFSDDRSNLIDTITDLSAVSSSIETIVREVNGLETESIKIQKDILFYHNNDTCPKCKQGIVHEFKQEIITEHQTDLNAIDTAIQTIKVSENKLQERISEIRDTQKRINELSDIITTTNSDIRFNEQYIQRLKLEAHDLEKKVGNIDTEKKKLKDIAAEALVVAKERSDLNRTQHYFDIAALLLKDSGIKTKIIKQYLPVINKLVNKYLTAMDFFVQFTLNEKFDESIKSRHRDDFCYESFSEGEKQRIDLALIFTWRTIAKLKNSASTNLLILDEVFDSSLDSAATEHVMTLLNTFGDGTNIFVISHKRDQLFDKFSNIIRFQKKKNFSVMV